MRARYFFIASVVLASLAIVGLRANAQRVLTQRNQIIAADVAGKDVTTTIEALRQRVFKHMNSSVQFELGASYERAVVAAQHQAVSGSVYSQAQAACNQPVSALAQAQCVQAYLSQRLQNAPVTLPERSRYTYAFASPTWSPDFAGLALLAALAAGLTALGVYVLGLFRNRLAE